MKGFIIILFIGLITSGLSQTGLTKALENQTTKNQQTKVVVDYTKQYERYLRKADRQSNMSTVLLVTSSVITSAILLNVDDISYNRPRTLILVNGFFIGASTTFTISSRNNRRKAYELKRQSYL